MQKCDVAVSAAGSTLYELCCVGVPILCYTLADNQIDMMTEFERRGFAFSIGDVRKTGLSILDIENKIGRQLNYDTRKKMSLNGRVLIDGCGAIRLSKELIALINRNVI